MRTIKINKQKIAALTAVFAVVASPAVASAATDSANTTVNATVQASISITSSSPVALTLAPTAGGVVTSASDTVTVDSNNTAGYDLTLADADANTNLVSGGNNIAAHSGTYASPTTLTNGTWGYAVASLNNFDASYSTETNNTSSSSIWAGVPATGSAQNIKSTTGVATADVTTVWYAARVNTSQPTGTYTDTVTYTATTK